MFGGFGGMGGGFGGEAVEVDSVASEGGGSGGGGRAGDTMMWTDRFVPESGPGAVEAARAESGANLLGATSTAAPCPGISMRRTPT